MTADSLTIEPNVRKFLKLPAAPDMKFCANSSRLTSRSLNAMMSWNLLTQPDATVRDCAVPIPCAWRRSPTVDNAPAAVDPATPRDAASDRAMLVADCSTPTKTVFSLLNVCSASAAIFTESDRTVLNPLTAAVMGPINNWNLRMFLATERSLVAEVPDDAAKASVADFAPSAAVL